MASETGNSLDIAFDKGLQQAFPPVMVQLLKSLLDPSPSFTAISNYLNMDPLLAAKVLHVVNTTSYGFKEKITDLQRAVIAIGTNELFKLILALLLQKKLNPVYERDPELVFGDWRLTLWAALAAEAIASRLCPKDRQVAYLVGMLKDLPLYLAFCQNEVPPFLQHKRFATLPTEGQFAEELVNWGQTHPEMTRDIFLFWGFTEEMAEAATMHHDYENISAYPPLAQSVIYATRWAELLHAPQTDMPALSLFESNMAAELGLSNLEMTNFRSTCADRFNRLLDQLGIVQNEPGMRIHDQSLARLQSHYFLALGTLSCIKPNLPQSFAAMLQKQLRLTWGIKDWDLKIRLVADENICMFRCRGDHGLITDISGKKAPPPNAGWQRIPIVCNNHDFGMLIVPPHLKRHEDESSLPMYVNMLAMVLEELHKTQFKQGSDACLEDLPFIVARLDKDGGIQEASAAFRDVFKLNDNPEGHPAGELLLRHLGIDLPPIESDGDEDKRAGFFLSVPEGHFPGTPLYISRIHVHGGDSESFLFIGDVTRMNSQQALAMAHQGLLGALFETLNEQICLLDEQGRIIWTDESCRELLGKNIFSLSKPDASSPSGQLSAGGGRWNSSFLNSLVTSTKIQVLLALGGSLVPYRLIFSPLEGKSGRQYLLMLHITPPNAQAPTQESPKPQAVRPKDSLTDLYGYSQFHILLKYTTEQARKHEADTGIIFCDIEGLHKYNALHGYQKGDTVLRRVAGCLAENCRPGQDHACRYGSDKFAMVIYRASREMLDDLAANIHTQAKERCDQEITLNIGLVLVGPEEHPKSRLDAARRASEQAGTTPERTLWAE